ncbi:hypothetical protein BH23ACT9_BH23ACT9_25720 [soil metagenome]
MAVIFLGLVVLALIGGGIAFAVALARSGKAQLASQNELFPGVPSNAPAEWGGAHTTEAKLHRRLGQAVRALQAQTGDSRVELLDLRVQIEQQALAVDERLIAASALPEHVKGETMTLIEQAVDAIEQATGRLAAELTSSGLAADTDGLAEVTERVRLAAEARAEVEALDWIGTEQLGQSGEDPDEDGQAQPGSA